MLFFVGIGLFGSVVAEDLRRRVAVGGREGDAVFLERHVYGDDVGLLLGVDEERLETRVVGHHELVEAVDVELRLPTAAVVDDLRQKFYPVAEIQERLRRVVF